MKRLALLPLLLASTALAQAPSPAQMGITQGTPQSLQYLDKNKNWVPVGALNDVRQFGAKCDNATDDLAAINAALAAVKAVYIPSGTCQINGTINVTQNGSVIAGAGMAASNLISASSNLPVIKVAAGLEQVTLSGFTVDRSVTATSGGDGLDFTAGGISARVTAVRARNHWHGFDLGGIANGQLFQDLADQNYGDGFHLTNSTANQAGQWEFIDSSSVFNNGYGISVTASPNTTMPMLPWIGNNVFANTLGGAYFTGSSTGKTADIQICGGGFSSNGSHNIYLDFVVNNASVGCGVLVELAGQTATGRGAATPASNTGRGIFATGGVGSLSVGSALIYANSREGMVSGAFRTQVTGATVLGNGMAAPGTLHGINIQNTTAGSTGMVTGTTSGNLNGGSSVQGYGVLIQDGTSATITGNDLCFNAVDPIQLPTNSTSASVQGNLCAVYQQSGIGNIAAASFNKVITHGMTKPPTQVIVAANSPPGVAPNEVGIWADTFTSTTFTVHLTNSTTTGVNFSWVAKVFNY